MSMVPPPIFSCAVSCARAEPARVRHTNAKKKRQRIELIFAAVFRRTGHYIDTERRRGIPCIWINLDSDIMEREHHYSVAVVWTGNTDAGIVVVSYEDNAEGSMIETAEGGRFTNVT